MIDKIWAVIVLVSILFGLVSGRGNALGNAALNGAAQAVTLVIGLTGMLCFWQGMMAVMRECGAAGALAKLLRRPVGMLMKKTRHSSRAMETVCANISANLLGLSNAATPFGIEAAKALSDGSEAANDDLCMLVVINSASLQLIPSTVAALRASLGSSAPYDILPAVWVTTLASQAAGIAAAIFFSKTRKKSTQAGMLRAARPGKMNIRRFLPFRRKKRVE